MNPTTEIELVRRIFGYLDTRTTAMSDRGSNPLFTQTVRRSRVDVIHAPIQQSV